MAKVKKVSHFRAISVKIQSLYALLSRNNPAFKPAMIIVGSFFLGLIVGASFLPVASSTATSDVNIQVSAEPTPDPTPLPEKAAPEKTDSALSAERDLATSYIAAASTNPTSVAPLSASSQNLSAFSIPSLGVNSSLVSSNLSSKELSVPASGVSFYGSLYMGHSAGVFARLSQASAGAQIYINGTAYTITSVQINLPVWSNRQGVGDYHMAQLINLGTGQIVLMTCSGAYQDGFGWTGRTLVFASQN